MTVQADKEAVLDGLSAYWDEPSEYHDALDRLAALAEQAETLNRTVVADRVMMAQHDARSDDARRLADADAEAAALRERLADAERERDHLRAVRKLERRQLAEARKGRSAAERQLAEAREALRQARDCCARPPGVCFDPALASLEGGDEA